MNRQLEEAIDKCLDLSKKINDITFIFRKDTSYSDDSETDYQVSDISMIENYPSRVPIYDSQFKQLNKYRKFDRVYSVISKLGFSPSVSNLGERYEQVFTREIELNGYKTILNLRLQPNLLCKIDYIYSNGLISPYKGYFEYNRVYASLAKLEDMDIKQFLREITIDEILD